jgi:hypothetical protein
MRPFPKHDRGCRVDKREEVGWPHGLKLKTLIKSLLEKIF